MPNPLILSIDQGTTNTKVLLVDGAGRIVARASRPLGQRFPQPGWVEQDPLEIWAGVRWLGRCFAHFDLSAELRA